MENKWEYLVVAGVFIGLLALNIIFIEAVDTVQGDARLINYTGIVRGGSQRLIKKELFGVEDVMLIEQVDEILQEMKSGQGKYDLPFVQDERFVTQLYALDEKWIQLKQAMEAYRSEGDQQRLYLVGEEFFVMANKLTFIAEEISQEKVEALLGLKVLLFVLTLIIMVIFSKQMYVFIYLNSDMCFLRERADKDMMTGLPNRSCCDSVIEGYHHRSLPANMVCIFMDLNNLKYVNDTYGHRTGDALIIDFAEILTKVVRPLGFVGRRGGDEFVAFLENFDQEKLLALMQRIDHKVQEKNQGSSLYKIDYSWGAACSAEQPDANIRELMDIADGRMYDFKRNKKSSWSIRGKNENG